MTPSSRRALCPDGRSWSRSSGSADHASTGPLSRRSPIGSRVRSVICLSDKEHRWDILFDYVLFSLLYLFSFFLSYLSHSRMGFWNHFYYVMTNNKYKLSWQIVFKLFYFLCCFANSSRSFTTTCSALNGVKTSV